MASNIIQKRIFNIQYDHMEKEFQDKLYNNYPELFVQKDWPMTKTCMVWGISCNIGWYDILDKLCSNIMSYCKENNIEIPQFGQIKEKFGTLRIYIDGADDKIYKMVSDAEDESCNTCEDCGSKEDTITAPREGGCWVLTLCKKCRNREDGRDAKLRE